MTPSKRLKPVQRLADSREKKAAKHFGDSQRNLVASKAKLEELRQYHAEYLQRYEKAARAGMTSAQLQEYQAFIAKLNEAIRAQEQIVETSQLDKSNKQATWRQKHTRIRALDKVVERYEKEEARMSEKREQDEADERSQRPAN